MLILSFGGTVINSSGGRTLSIPWHLGSTMTDSDTHVCPQISVCAMYTIFQHRGTLASWKSLYCTLDHERCERYKLVACGRSVAINLLPNGILLKVKDAAK